MPRQVGVVRYGLLRRIAEFVAPPGTPLSPRQACVVQTSRGVELGEVLAVVEREEPQGASELLRAASEDDRARARRLEARSAEELEVSRRATRERAELRVVGLERLLGDERAVVYYTATGRPDVPALLALLGGLLGGEVRLEQIGARQQARLCGGCGACGRALCCASFLRALTPVTMRMAKVQGLDLSPRATAGACGRLKCCLRYEHSLYAEAGDGLPRVGWRVRTRRLAGRVVAVDILRRRLLVRPEEGAPRPVFAAEVDHAEPPPRAPLPLAGEANGAGSPPPAARERERERAEEPEESAPEPGWSQLAKRLWRRVNPRARGREEPGEGDG